MSNPNIDLKFSKDADITEILGMNEKMTEMQSHLNSNISDSQVNLNKKINELNNFLKTQYSTSVNQIKHNSIAEFYVK